MFRGSNACHFLRQADPALHRGSVLLIVLITLVFASFALITFMDKATNDLLVDHRDARALRLRREAYSALEVTLAVLEDFRIAKNGLRSPAEGWSDPLGFAGYTPPDGLRIDVAFEDESGKISLPKADVMVLTRLFESWDVSRTDAEMLADAMMGWMRRDHIYSTAINPTYDQGPLPFEPPARSLRSYAELAAIEGVREFLYDSSGRPNALWHRFASAVSLFDFLNTNINGAGPDALAALGLYDEFQQARFLDFLNGRGEFEGEGGGFVSDPAQAGYILGPGGNPGAFGTTIHALRIVITVHEDRSQYRLAAVVTQGGSAKPVQEKAHKRETTTASAKSSSEQKAAPKADQPDAQKRDGDSEKRNLKYPFTLLEIRENDEISPLSPTTAPET